MENLTEETDEFASSGEETFVSHVSDEFRKNQLAEKYYQSVHHRARSTVGQDDAGEVTSETFIRTLSRFDRIEPGKDRAFLFGVLRRTRMDWIRKKSRAGLPIEDADTAAHTHFGTHPPTADREMRAKRIKDVVGQLSPGHREVIVMHYFQGMTLEEIAAAIGARPAAVRQRHHRAKRALLSLFGEAGIGADFLG